MRSKEKLNVYVRYENNRVTCLCLRQNRKCGRSCERETVERDLYYGWKQTFYQDRYGKSDLR